MVRVSFARTEERFYQLFETVARNLGAAVDQLAAMLHESGDYAAQAAQVKHYEQTGDTLTGQLFTLLHQTHFPPLSPAAVQRLTGALDDVLDAVDAAAENLVIYRVEQLRPEATEIGDLLVQAAQEVLSAVLLLRRRSDWLQIQGHSAALHRLENEVDRVSRHGLAQVIVEREAFELIRWTAIYDQLERAADRCEDVADVLDQIMRE